MKVKVLSFDEALERAGEKRHLLLGNGFSCALEPGIFRYQALKDAARFDETSEAVFDVLETIDFEKAIRALDVSATVSPCFGVRQRHIDAMADYSQRIKHKLVETLAATHPARPCDVTDAAYKSCWEFLGYFLPDGKVYTLNYDLLLYWTIMGWLDRGGPRIDDGFRSDEDNPEAPYVVWDGSGHSINVYYLHGALHLLDAGSSVRKITWCRTDTSLIEQINNALDRGVYPLFVSEGTAEQKMDRIMHSGYLDKGLRSLERIGHSLFLYGISMSDNDAHIIKAIRDSNVARMFVGIYGDPSEAGNQDIIARVRLLQRQRDIKNPRKPLDAEFFDSGSAYVWNKYKDMSIGDILGRWPMKKKVLVAHDA